MQALQPTRSPVYSTRAVAIALPPGSAPAKPDTSAPAPESTPQEVFNDPIVQLAALCPLCALAALSPEAALAALSPTLRTFNPAINPRAALLAFTGYNPARLPRGRVGR